MKSIVLSIPHAVPCRDFSTWSNPENIKKEHDKWTDWFTDVVFASENPKVTAVCAPLSRFDLDMERLIGDGMESQGQGIIYTMSKNGISKREISIEEQVRRTLLYVEYHAKLANLLQEDGSLLIDCHSYPTDFSEAGNASSEQANASGAPIDVCLGFNEDSTRPSDGIIALAKSTFESAGYTVGINKPYSNAIVVRPDRPSLMIELSKRTYLDENTLQLLPSAEKLNHVLNELYEKILCFKHAV